MRVSSGSYSSMVIWIFFFFLFFFLGLSPPLSFFFFDRFSLPPCTQQSHASASSASARPPRLPLPTSHAPPRPCRHHGRRHRRHHRRYRPGPPAARPRRLPSAFCLRASARQAHPCQAPQAPITIKRTLLQICLACLDYRCRSEALRHVRFTDRPALLGPCHSLSRLSDHPR